jgi:hypothetical protein
MIREYCVGFVMCGCVYVWVFDNCMGVLVIRVLVFTVFLCWLYSVVCIVSFMYIYTYLLLVQGLLPPYEDSIAINNNNNNNNNNINLFVQCAMEFLDNEATFSTTSN